MIFIIVFSEYSNWLSDKFNVKDILSLEVPIGTVGGLIAFTKILFFNNSFSIWTVFPLSPITIGIICEFVFNVFIPFWLSLSLKYFEIFWSLTPKLGLFSIISSDFIIPPIIPGVKAVVKIKLLALFTKYCLIPFLQPT